MWRSILNSTLVIACLALAFLAFCMGCLTCLKGIGDGYAGFWPFAADVAITAALTMASAGAYRASVATE